jgi:hypothetical protein
MAYLGQGAEGNFTTTNAKDTFSGDGAETTFTLSQRGTENNVDVFVNNVRQEPGVAYNIEGNGTSLVFTAAPSTGTNNIYVVNRGPAELSASHPASQNLAAADGTFTGDLTVDTSTLKVDSTNNRVGIGTINPSQALTVNGAGARIYLTGANEDIDMDGSANGQIQIDGNGYTGAIALNADGLQIYNNSASRAIIFGTNETERMRILSGGGLTFNGDTAAANALDDYEEGTFTLTLDNVDNTGLTVYSAQYVKVGNMVTVSFYIVFPTVTDSSAISIQLPFNAVSLSNGWQAGTIGYNTSGNEDQGTLIQHGTNNLQIRNKANGTQRNYTSYSGNAIIASITYRTA